MFFCFILLYETQLRALCQHIFTFSSLRVLGNWGRASVTGLSVAQSLPDAISEAKAFNGLAQKVKDNWDKVRSTTKTLKEKQDALPSTVGEDAKGKATTARNDAAEKAATALQ